MNDTTKVLLVDDNELDRKWVHDLLGGLCCFHVAHSITDAMRLLGSEKFNVILLDVGMPDSASDLDSLERIKQVANDAPIVLYTGNDNQEFLREAMRRTASGFIVKGQGDRTARDMICEMESAMRSKQFLVGTDTNVIGSQL